jgi:NADH:ubiquinone oxidoreductase subunit E
MDNLEIISGFSPEKANIISALHALQDNHPQNYLPEESLKATAKYFKVNLSWIYGVVGYYSMFSLEPRGRYIIRLCTSPVCNMMGSTDILGSLRTILNIKAGETTPDGLFSIEECECLGLCDSAPAMIINREIHGNLTPDSIEDAIKELRIKQNEHR